MEIKNVYKLKSNRNFTDDDINDYVILCNYKHVWCKQKSNMHIILNY